MKKFLSFLLVTLLPLVANAETVEIDGIYYNLVLKAKKAEVTNSAGGSKAFPLTVKYSGSVNIPASVTYDGEEFNVIGIGMNAFWSCSGLTSITIPNSVAWISNCAFDSCTGLTSVYITDLSAWCNIIFEGAIIFSNPLCYAHHLYLNNEEIKDLIIPNNVTRISNGAFYGCNGLTSVTIPNSVTSIGNACFSNCSNLTSITIPSSVISISGNPFSDCSRLNSIKVESENTTYDSRDNCNAIIETATNTLIAGCKDTTIPNSVMSIGGSAFFGCSGLTYITIPESVTSINDYAFSDCSSLTDVYCYAIKPPSSAYNYSFDISHVEEYTTLHVPALALEQYKTTNLWRSFKNIVALTDEDAIVEVEVKNITDSDYYDLNGRKLNKPQKGINIIRYSDGTTRKVLIK